MAAETVFNTTIEDTSMMYDYKPYVDGAAGIGWFTEYTGGSSERLGHLFGNGESRHVTSASGSSVSLSFYGSAIHVFGDASGVAYDVLLDGKISKGKPQGNILLSIPSLNRGEHNLTIVAYPEGDNQRFILDKTVVTVPTGRTVAAVTDDTYDDENPAFRFTGTFFGHNDPLVPNQSPAFQTVHHSNGTGDTATVLFQGSAILLYGFSNRDHGQYQIQLDSEPARIFNQTTKHYVVDALLFYRAGLDPNKTHTMALTNLDGSHMDIDFARAIRVTAGLPFTPTDEPKDPAPPNVQLILGLTLGLLGLAALLLGIWLCYRRRKRKHDKLEKLAFLVEPDPFPSVPTSRVASPQPVQIFDHRNRVRVQAQSTRSFSSSSTGSIVTDHTPSSVPSIRSKNGQGQPQQPPQPPPPAATVGPLAPEDINQILQFVAQRVGGNHMMVGDAAPPPDYAPRPSEERNQRSNISARPSREQRAEEKRAKREEMLQEYLQQRQSS